MNRLIPILMAIVCALGCSRDQRKRRSAPEAKESSAVKQGQSTESPSAPVADGYLADRVLRLAGDLDKDSDPEKNTLRVGHMGPSTTKTKPVVTGSSRAAGAEGRLGTPSGVKGSTDDNDGAQNRDPGAVRAVVRVPKKLLGGRVEAPEPRLAEETEAEPEEAKSEAKLEVNEKKKLDLRKDTSARDVFASTLKDKEADRASDAFSGNAPTGDPTQARQPFSVVRREEPLSFIPDFCYFENTYLGGNAGYRHHLERLDRELRDVGSPHRLALPARQSFEAPPKKGLALSAALDARSFEGKGRVYLQIGLQGSHRFGWRRPPLEVALVLDPAALAAGPEAARELIRTLVRQLGPQDQLGVVLAGSTPTRVAELGRMRRLRAELLPELDRLAAQPTSSAAALSAGLTEASRMLQQAAARRSTLPGTQTVLLFTAGADAARTQVAAGFADAASEAGIVTSVLEFGSAPSGSWWQVASNGHGNYHRAKAGELDRAVRQELDTLARVVARLLRVNVRLAEGVKAVRVLGADILNQRTVERVKAREVATDRRLSEYLGIAADRGEDDDGIQTVIPYFYGGDSHVIVLELWVDRPGKVADVSLRYKDMVNLDNATARTAVYLRNVPRPLSEAQLVVQGNLQGFGLAETLDAASARMRSGDGHGALALLQQARSALPASSGSDQQLLAGFVQWIQGGQWVNDSSSRRLISEALDIARQRKLGGAVSGS